MSRIGIKPIQVPDGVTVEITDRLVRAKGPKGENKVEIPARIDVTQEGNVITVTRRGENGAVRALHGMARSRIANAVMGTHEEFIKALEIQGVGYRAKLVGENLELSVGYSHPVVVKKTAGTTFQVKGNKITVSGPNKEIVGQVAADIRAVRPPDSYKGKGLRYVGEVVKLKAGKAAKAAGAA